jgi:membrane protein implicated in regulation of membrane protease activity
MMKPFTSIAVFLFALMAFGHLLRVLAGWQLVIGVTVVPMWPSVVVFLVFGGLAIMLWREARRGTVQDILAAVGQLKAEQ